MRFVYAPGHIICREGDSMAITITLAVSVAAVLLALAVVLVISSGPESTGVTAPSPAPHVPKSRPCRGRDCPDQRLDHQLPRLSAALLSTRLGGAYCPRQSFPRPCPHKRIDAFDSFFGP